MFSGKVQSWACEEEEEEEEVGNYGTFQKKIEDCPKEINLNKEDVRDDLNKTNDNNINDKVDNLSDKQMGGELQEKSKVKEEGWELKLRHPSLTK